VSSPKPPGLSVHQHRLATNVRELRLARGLSQEDLAFEAGIDRTYQSQIERAIGNPSLRVLCAIAQALNVDLLDLLSERKTQTE
jgi:transcriptional regulator with XRE-family HTH domain